MPRQRHKAAEIRRKEPMIMKKAVMLINDTTYAYNLRGALIESLVGDGWQVVIAGQRLQHVEKLEAMGARLVDVETGRHGKDPLADLRLLRTYAGILRRERPDVVLSYNIKPNVYGGMACRRLGIPFLPNVTGLGTPVENPGPLQVLTIGLYRAGVRGAACVFFQNEANKQFFEDHHMLKKGARTRVLPGSGVDLEKHPVLNWPGGEAVHFLFAARVMKQKGIDLFLAAARKYAGKNVIFDVCGGCDDAHYRGLLQNEKCVVYHGEQKDMTPFYRQCACFLYPSYYPEGMSNVLLEAAASGRPVIAADRPGCRETLQNEVTGFLVPVNDEAAVLAAVEKILAMTGEERRCMGLRGAERVRREFDRRLVVQAYREEIERLQING